MLHVPYKGGSALVAALLAGEVQSGWSGIPNVAPHIRSGKLKVYAISTARRSASLPDVPTTIELGYPGFDIATVIGLQAPGRHAARNRDPAASRRSEDPARAGDRRAHDQSRHGAAGERHR